MLDIAIQTKNIAVLAEAFREASPELPLTASFAFRVASEAEGKLDKHWLPSAYRAGAIAYYKPRSPRLKLPTVSIVIERRRSGWSLRSILAEIETEKTKESLSVAIMTAQAAMIAPKHCRGFRVLPY